MKNWIKSAVFLFVISTSGLVFSQDTIFFENFDDSPGAKPYGWTTELETGGNNKWQFVNGGGFIPPELPGSRRPPSAYSGEVNALYFFESLLHNSVILITPAINLEYAVKPELRFQLAQVYGDLGPGPASDEMVVYYKTHFDSAWVESKLLAEYTDPVGDWTEQTILIPEAAYVSTCYFAFKATTNHGYGVCIDDVSILETGVLDRYLDTLTIQQVSTDLVVSGTELNPLLRIDLSVKGNTGDVLLNSLDVSSLNTSDDDVPVNGVKILYNSSNRNFYEAVIYDSVSLNSGNAVFTGLDLTLPTGNTSVWITFDLTEDAIHGNYIDAKLLTNSIVVNSITYPSTEVSPPGNRLIQKSVFYDDFFTDKNWILEGDFERARPTGLGGINIGNKDPEFGALDTMILGNDLTGLGTYDGDYEANQLRYENLATSQAFNLYYYNNVKLNFLRWLNVENEDTASIELSLDDGSSWKEAWSNRNEVITENTWNLFSMDLSQANRTSDVKIRINLGPTTSNNHFSGWNIDNFSITGNYVEYDVGPTTLISPGDGCGHSSAETVTVKVRNFGPGATPDKIPVRYSFDDGATYQYDTIEQVISFNSEITYAFGPTLDLSEPGTYNVLIETLLDVDEESTNNIFDTVLYVDPTYTLPYLQDFESGEGLWRSAGTNSSLEWGVPAGPSINTAASGNKAWVTNLTTSHNDDEISILSGPCFDFSGIDYPVFECKIFSAMQADADGANVEYSLDNGQSWTRLGDQGDGDGYNWNWYNSNAVASLPGSHGWTGEEADWKTARIFLDTTIFRGLTSVKFRFQFISDAFNTKDGIGIDDIRVYDAPADLGVISIESPVDGCAQNIGDHVEVTIKNFGLDTLMAGDTIIVGYDFAAQPTEIDTFVLAGNLLKNETISYTFEKFLTVSSSGTKEINAFTLLPDDVDFYNDITTNDTSSKSIDVALTPFTNLPYHIYTVRPDTIILNAYTGSPGDDYLWQDLVDNDSAFHVTEKADGIYHVIASNAFCDYRDTTRVYFLIADAGITNLTYPESSCELGSAVLPEVIIKNFGTDTLNIGDEITVGYILDFDPAVEEVAVLGEEVYPDSSFGYSFTTPADMSDIKSYSVLSYTALAYDDSTHNDSLLQTAEVYGITEIDLGPDTVVRALEYTIDPGAGYDSYQWQDGTEAQSLVIDTTGWYKVTVTQGTMCENSDSVHITLIIPDIGIDRISNPANACILSSTENLDVYVHNVGSDTLTANDTILVTYQINSGTVVNDTLFVDKKVFPGDSVLFTAAENVDLSVVGVYDFIITVDHGEDLIASNDILNQDIEAYGNPEVSLGDDQVATLKTFELDGGMGFASYSWQDGSEDQYFTVLYENQEPDQTYTVNVIDIHGCQGSDDIVVTFELTDIGIEALTSVKLKCLQGCHLVIP